MSAFGLRNVGLRPPGSPGPGPNVGLRPPGLTKAWENQKRHISCKKNSLEHARQSSQTCRCQPRADPYLSHPTADPYLCQPTADPNLCQLTADPYIHMHTNAQSTNIYKYTVIYTYISPRLNHVCVSPGRPHLCQPLADSYLCHLTADPYMCQPSG